MMICCKCYRLVVVLAFLKAALCVCFFFVVVVVVVVIWVAEFCRKACREARELMVTFSFFLFETRKKKGAMMMTVE